jgi:hypothetical protein
MRLGTRRKLHLNLLSGTNAGTLAVLRAGGIMNCPPIVATVLE